MENMHFYRVGEKVVEVGEWEAGCKASHHMP